MCMCVSGWEFLTVSWEVYRTLQWGAPSPGIQAITSLNGFLDLMI